MEDKSLPFAIALYSVAAIITLLVLTFRRYSTASGKVGFEWKGARFLTGFEIFVHCSKHWVF